MLIICELLKESDLRFPNSYGSAISILGALIIGEAAVNAGIVSPIMEDGTLVSFPIPSRDKDKFEDLFYFEEE